MLAAVAGSARRGAVMRREMESLPEDVLRQAALEKGPSGCATKREIRELKQKLEDDVE